jgi:ABC-type antimicrobial peptide transport system permease subunit
MVEGQPTKEDGTAYSEWIYDSAIVVADDVEHVDELVKKIQDMGFQAESNKEYVDMVQRSTKIVQILLGGIGAIALIVAVIGISNTMTTAVYDRIGEIGVLKVLGCDPGELLGMFLLEAGILGGVGGIIGIAISYLITEVGVNIIAVRAIEMAQGIRLAEIPWWLAVGAFLFAILLGVLAGFFPARWASRLRPIDAVRAL